MAFGAQEVSVVFACANNLLASVSIILLNKHILSVCNFHFIVTLLFLNFLTTYVVLDLASRFAGVFEQKHMPTKDRWLISLMAVLTVLFNNASSEANSVGFYQICKLLIIPTVIMIERVQGVKRAYSSSILLALFVTAIGVATATFSDVQLNSRGCILMGISNLVTAQYQLWQSGKQSEHKLTGMQITHTTGFPQSVIALLGSLVLDVFFPHTKRLLLLRPGSLLEHQFGPTDGLWIAACCAVAVYMNASTYILLGKTSPVSYQVLGQFKTVLIVGFGYMLFDHQVPFVWLAVRMAGVVVAVTGAFYYSTLKYAEQQAAKEQTAKKSS